MFAGMGRARDGVCTASGSLLINETILLYDNVYCTFLVALMGSGKMRNAEYRCGVRNRVVVRVKVKSCGYTHD